MTRPHCYRCDKPQIMCVCSSLRRLPNAVGVHVLQHPRERRHPLGTVRLLRLGLADVAIHVLDLSGEGSASTPVDLPAGAGLLYPSADARDLPSLSASERPTHLVAIDGTWAHANRIYKDNPWIAALPHYRLTPAEGSRYRIRAEPRLECLSTVESVVAALRCLQPDLEGTEMLDDAFDAMIDAQIAASETRPARHVRSKQSPRKPPRAIPAALLAPDARVIAVYAEALPAPKGIKGPTRPIRVSAATLDGEQVFDQLVQPLTPPDAHGLGLLGIEQEAITSAASPEAVIAALLAFCEGEGPLVLASWAPRTQRWLNAHLDGAPCVMLKGVWANLQRTRIPGLDTLAVELGLDVPALPIPGRAGPRLARTCAMARHILSRRSMTEGGEDKLGDGLRLISRRP